MFIRPALKIEAKTTQNRDNIIFIVPCERRSWGLLQKSENYECHSDQNVVEGRISEMFRSVQHDNLSIYARCLLT